ncbi:MAG: amidohydrolase [Mogibacterium sp.]|nr:amidohydrolase [Mogibacterium sp.]MBR2539696.1 amidohydrolase [Mogibacterium sp.]
MGTYSKQNIIDYVDSVADEITGVSHSIWEFAELSLKEVKSAALYVEKLKEYGFEVETGYADIETSFSGKFVSGSGKPVIGILGEFDALSGLSQKACCTHHEEIVPNGSGHGCGHNMLGAASFGAALAVKEYLEKTGSDGTVIFYGCPGEEGGASKAFMAREGIWKSLDAALTWHPGTTNEVTTGTNNSCTQVLYKFKGIAAHAAGNPEAGRSALDAVELMNIGVNYLREHMKADCRIHYAMVDGGGLSPNVVQPHASVLYMVRSTLVKDVLDLQARVDKCADGAAMMTETTYERIFVDGTANAVPNTTLEKLLFDNMQIVPLPEYTEEEKAFAAELDATCPPDYEIPGHGSRYDMGIKKTVKELSGNGTKYLNDFLIPFYSGDEFSPGSSDVGDVSWQTPTAQFNAVNFTAHSPGHSWQNVSCGASSIGDKGTVYAAKVLACAASDLFSNTRIIDAAREEFLERLDGEEYTCPIPDGVPPYIIEE